MVVAPGSVGAACSHSILAVVAVGTFGVEGAAKLVSVESL